MRVLAPAIVAITKSPCHQDRDSFDTISGDRCYGKWETRANLAFLPLLAAWLGEKDLAIEQLKIVTQLPSGLNYGELIDRIFLGSRLKFAGADAIRDRLKPDFRAGLILAFQNREKRLWCAGDECR